MSNSILLGNLPVDTTEEKLQDWISDSGLNVKVAVQVNEDGNCVGFARLHVDSTEEAEKLISGYDREEFCGRIVYMHKETTVAPPENWFAKLKSLLFPHPQKPRS